MLTVKQVADKAGLSASTVYGNIRAGWLKHVQIGNCMFVNDDPETLKSWLRSRSYYGRVFPHECYQWLQELTEEVSANAPSVEQVPLPPDRDTREHVRLLRECGFAQDEIRAFVSCQQRYLPVA